MVHLQNAERRLVMTFQMSQALTILQMTNRDLEQFLQEEFEKNPLLEECRKETVFYDQDIASQMTRDEFLSRQIQETFLDSEEREIAEKITEFLDEKGFLSVENSEIPVDQEDIESILPTLQTFLPPGIFARNLQESLLLQLERKGLRNSEVYLLIENDYDDLLHHRYSLLKKKYPKLDLPNAIQKISSLQLRPLESLKKEIISPMIPDLYIRETDDGWLIGMFDEAIPHFRIQYAELEINSKEEQKTIDLWRSSAKWLLKALHRRREIILQIAMRITHHQVAYLSAKGPLVHFTIQNLSQELGLHESTISRALSEKYVETPRGIILLKSLLTTSPQKKEAKEIIQELVMHETVPLTDDELASALLEKGLHVARRTVSKYRKELKIPTTKLRAMTRR